MVQDGGKVVSQVLFSNLGQGYGYSGTFSCYYSVSDVNVAG